MTHGAPGKTSGKGDRRKESGNIFFTLFGAVALVGVVGVATATLMRGPLGTVVRLNQNAKADSQMQIAHKLAMLEAAQEANDGDCDTDNYVEPIGPLSVTDPSCAGPVPNGGGCLPPSFGASRNDPWGTNYGYCAWNHGFDNTTPACSTNGSNVLAGKDGSDKTVIAIISAGPDRTFQTTCSSYVNDSTVLVAKGGDDLVLDISYAGAVEASGGLWQLKSADTATIGDRNIEVGGQARLQSGGEFSGGDFNLSGGALAFKDDSMLLLPNNLDGSFPSGSDICNNANYGSLRINFSSGSVVQICDTTNAWSDVGGTGSAVSASGTVDGAIQMGDGDGAFKDDGANFNYSASTLNVPNINVSGDIINPTGSDPVSINDDLDVNNGLTVGGDLDVSGDIDGTDITASGTVSGGTISASAGGLDSSGGLTVSAGTSTLLGTTVTDLTATGTTIDLQGTIGNSVGNLDITDDVDLTGALSVSGIIYGSSDAQVSGDVLGRSFQNITNAVGGPEGLFFSSTGEVALQTNGNNRLTIDQTGDSFFTGDVGIGITSAAPTATLDIDGEIRLRSSSSYASGNLCSQPGMIAYSGSDELMICSENTGKWETVGTSGGGGGGIGGLWTDDGNYIRYDNYTFITKSGSTLNFDSALEGAGTRLLWYTSAAALRAGQVSGSQWDNGNVGNFSAAFGLDTVASADSTFAAGSEAEARATSAIALGNQVYVEAGGLNSIALGNQVRVRSSAVNSMGIGLGVPTGTEPFVSGSNSLGIFMGDQRNVDFTSSNVMGIFGGRLVIDPNTPATKLSADGVLDVDVEGDVGALQYCDADGNNCFTAEAVASGSVGVPGADSEVLFNSGGALGSSPNMLYLRSTGQFSVGAVYLKSSGALGLGTSSPTANIHIKKPTTEATMLMSGAGTWNDAWFTMGSESTGNQWSMAMRGPSDPQSGDLMYSFYDGSWHDYLRFTTAGNLGLGTLTPAAQLTLSEQLLLGNIDDCTAATQGALRLNATGDVLEMCDFNGTGDYVAIGGATVSAPGNDREIIFNSGGSLDTDTNFVFTSAGRMGIGTTTPSDNLDVYGTAQILFDSGSGDPRVMFHNGITNGDDPMMVMYRWYGVGSDYIGYKAELGIPSGTFGMDLSVAGQNTIGNHNWISDLFLAPGGKVGVSGALAPKAALDVNGTIKMAYGNEACDADREGAIQFDSSDNNFYVCPTGGGGWQKIVTSGASGSKIIDADDDTSVDVDTAGDGSANTISFTVSGDEIAFFSVSSGYQTMFFNPRLGDSAALDFFADDDGSKDYFVMENYGGPSSGYSQVRVGKSDINIFGAGGAGVDFVPAGRGGNALFGGLRMSHNDADDPTYDDLWITTANENGVLTTGITVPGVLNGSQNLALRTNDTTRMTIGANGNVGIGVQYSSALLDVAGTIKMAYGNEACDAFREGAIEFDSSDNNFYVCQSNGSGWQRIITAGGGGNGLPAAGNDTEIQFNSGGELYASSGLVFTSAGRVGIGTASPVADLHVWDANSPDTDYGYSSPLVSLGREINNFGTGGSIDFEYDWTGFGGDEYYTQARISVFDTFNYGGNIAFFTKPADGKWSATPGGANSDTSVERMRIDNEGNVGIGVQYSSALLDVAGTIKMAYGGEACDADREGAIQFDSSANKFYVCPSAGTWQEITVGGASASPAPGADTNIVYNSGGVLYASNDLVFASTGHVGIGTTSPDRGGLVVNKKVGATYAMFGQGSTDSVAIVGGGDANIALNAYYDSGWKSIGGGYSAFAAVDSAGAGNFYIFTTDSAATNPDDSIQTSLLQRLTIQPDGKVGIGTGSPAAPLDVAGEIKFSSSGLACSATADGGMVRWNGTLMQYCDGAAWQDFASGATATPGAPDRGIQFNSGGGFAAAAHFTYTSAGNFIVGSNQIDDTGTGTEDSRMFFDVSKGAFRAGNVDGTQWNESELGNFSTAFGYLAYASADYAFAAGRDVQASGTHSIAMGFGSRAGGNIGVAIGATALQTNANGGVAIGQTATSSGQDATAIGYNVTASSYGSNAFGYGVTASGSRSFAIGAADGSPVLSGGHSIGLFMGNQAGVDFASAESMGILGGNVVIDPHQPATNLVPDTALEVEGTIKMAYGGEACDADREGAIQFDSSANKFYVCPSAGTWQEITVGGASASPAPGADTNIVYNSGGVLYASSGFVFTSAGDLIVGSYQIGDTGTGTEDNRMYFNKATGAFRAGVAQNNEWDFSSAGNFSAAFGRNTVASGTGSFAVGDFDTRAEGYDSMAVGSTARAYGSESVALGQQTTASGKASLATGRFTSAETDYSTAMGWQVDVTGQAGFGVGLNNVSVTAPIVAGDFSYGIFMGNQSGVVLSSSQTMGLFGGKMVIDPAQPATKLSADTALDVNGTLKIADGGETCSALADGGMIRWNGTLMQYCDGATWQDFAAGATATPGAPDRGIQFNSGGGFAASSNFVFTSTGRLQLDDGMNNAIIGGGNNPFALALGNSIFGVDAGAKLTGGDSNVLVGRNAAKNIQDGNLNTVIGTGGGVSLVDGERNILIGQVDVPSPNISDYLNIGNVYFGSADTGFARTAGTLQIAYGGEACDASREGAIMYDSAADKFQVCSLAANGWQDLSAAGGSIFFTSLSDTPSSYAGAGGKFVRVNTGENALEFTDQIIDNVSGEPSPIAMALDDLSDVDVASVTGGQFLSYDSVSGTWVSASAGSASVAGGDREIQFNSNGTMASSSGFVYSSAGVLTLGAGGSPFDGGLSIDGGGVAAGFVATKNPLAYTSSSEFSTISPNQILISKDVTPVGDDVDAGITMAAVGSGYDRGVFLTREFVNSSDNPDNDFSITNVNSGGTLSLIFDDAGRFHFTSAAGYVETNPATFVDIEGTLQIGYTGELCDASREGAIMYDSAADKFQVCALAASGWQDLSAAGGSIAFTSLSDAPVSYAGQGGKFVRVNSGETAVEFTDQIIPQEAGAAPTGMALDDLSDVSVAGASDGDVLSYDSASGTWVTAAGGADAAGLNREIQFNSGGAMAAASEFFYDSQGRLTLSAPMDSIGYALTIDNRPFNANRDFIYMLANRSFDFDMKLENFDPTGQVSTYYRVSNADMRIRMNWVSSDSGRMDFLGEDDTTAIMSLMSNSQQVGVLQTDPQTALDVNGTLKIAYDSEACDASREGAIMYDSAADKFQVCALAANGWQDLSAAGGSIAFTSLTDAPSSYSGQGGKFVKVNSGETAVEFTDQIFDTVTGAPAPTGMVLNDLDDVASAGASDGDVLQYDSATGTWVTAASGGASAAGSDGEIQFNSNGGFGTDANFVFTSTGRLGVGTSSPEYALHVQQDLNVSAGSHLVGIVGRRNGHGVAVGLGYEGDGTSDTAAVISSYSTTFYPTDLSMTTYDGLNRIERMRIDSDGLVRFTSTGAVVLPVGTDAERPATAEVGMIRFSSTSGAFEGYDGSTWAALGTSGSTQIWTDETGRIGYDDSLGGARIAAVSGAASPVGATSGISGAMTGALDDLSDVDAASPGDGECLAYNSSSGAWESSATCGSGNNGVWSDSGSGYIEYASTLGGMVVASVTGANAPSGAVGSASSGASAFTDLSDVPSAYTGEGGKLVAVNAGETALEFVDTPQNGVWNDSGSGYIEYASILGGMKVAGMTGAAAPVGAIGSTSGGSDTLSGLSCAADQVASWDGSAWVCSDQSGLWSDSGSGYIEYASTLGGMQVAAVTGAAAPYGAVASGGGGTPGGADTQIQFNNSGSFDGSSSLTWASNTLSVTGDINLSSSLIFTPVSGLAAPVYMSAGSNGGGVWSLNGAKAYYNDGGVGIGTDDPTGELELRDESDEATIRFGGTGTWNDVTWIMTSLGAGAHQYDNWQMSMKGPSDANYGDIIWEHYDSSASSWQNSLTMEPSGEIGIGTTDPVVALDVVGDIQYTGTLTDVSDRRLKKDITPLDADDIIGRLGQIDTYSFRMIDDPKGQLELGVIAQEVEKTFPELVRTADNEMHTKSVNYIGFIAPLIEASKELKSENDDLRAQLADMKTQQAEMQAQQDDILKQVNGLKAYTGYGIGKAEIGLWMIAALFGFGGLFFCIGGIIRNRQRRAG